MKLEYSIEEIKKDKSNLIEEINQLDEQIKSSEKELAKEELIKEKIEKFDILLNIEEFCLEQSIKLIDDNHYDDYLQITKMQSEIDDINKKYKYKTERINKRIEELKIQIEETQDKIALDNSQYNAKKTNKYRINEIIKQSIDLQIIAESIYKFRTACLLNDDTKEMFKQSTDIKKTWELINNKEKQSKLKDLTKLEIEVANHTKNINEILKEKDELKKKTENAEETIKKAESTKLNSENIEKPKQNKQDQIKKPQEIAKEEYDKELENIIDDIIKEVNDEKKSNDAEQTKKNNILDDKISTKNNVENEDKTNKTTSDDKIVPEEIKIINEINPTLDDINIDIDIKENPIADDKTEETEPIESEIENESKKEITESKESTVTLTPEMKKRLEKYKNNSDNSRIENKVRRTIPKEKAVTRRKSVLEKIFNYFDAMEGIKEDEFDEIIEKELEGEEHVGGKSL